jgi:hypothetical protein
MPVRFDGTKLKGEEANELFNFSRILTNLTYWF